MLDLATVSSGHVETAARDRGSADVHRMHPAGGVTLGADDGLAPERDGSSATDATRDSPDHTNFSSRRASGMG